MNKRIVTIYPTDKWLLLLSVCAYFFKVELAAEDVEGAAYGEIYSFAAESFQLVYVLIGAYASCIGGCDLGDAAEEGDDIIFYAVLLSFHIYCVDKKFVTIAF